MNSGLVVIALLLIVNIGMKRLGVQEEGQHIPKILLEIWIRLMNLPRNPTKNPTWKTTGNPYENLQGGQTKL